MQGEDAAEELHASGYVAKTDNELSRRIGRAEFL
jgi:hypothetical protein